MKLIYTEDKETKRSGDLVEVGDKILFADVDADEVVTVSFFRPPHKPSSSGKVSVKYDDGSTTEVYVGVIGAEWIEREDRSKGITLEEAMARINAIVSQADAQFNAGDTHATFNKQTIDSIRF